MAELITIDRLPPWGVLESHLREGMFTNFDDPYPKYMLPKPYEYANITTARLNPNYILPTAKYVLKANLRILHKLRQQLLEEGIDIFNLNGIVQIDEQNQICPPVLEVWEEEPFNGIPVIVDGAHRLYLAKAMGREVNCVVISGNIAHMLPVLPLRGWQDVQEFDQVPRDKRNYDPHIPVNIKPHWIYRTPFPGSTGLRPPVQSIKEA